MSSPCNIVEKLPATIYDLKVKNGLTEGAQLMKILSTPEEKFGSVNQIVPVKGHKHPYGSCSRVVLTCDEKESLEPYGGTSDEEDDFITSSDIDAEVISGVGIVLLELFRPPSRASPLRPRNQGSPLRPRSQTPPLRPRR